MRSHETPTLRYFSTRARVCPSVRSWAISNWRLLGTPGLYHEMSRVCKDGLSRSKGKCTVTCMDAQLNSRRIRQREQVIAEIRTHMGRGRNGRRVTQTQIGAVLGLSAASVSERFLGRVAFNTDELDKIAEFFGVSMIDLLGPTEIEERVTRRLVLAHSPQNLQNLTAQNLKKMRGRRSTDGTRPGSPRPRTNWPNVLTAA